MRHFGELTAAARTTDEEEAANEDKTIIEAIHNTKVGFRHEMAQAKRSVFRMYIFCTVGVGETGAFDALATKKLHTQVNFAQ